MLCNFSLLFTCFAILCDLLWVGKDSVKPAKAFWVSPLQCVSHTTFFGKVVKFADSELNPAVLDTGKDVKQ